MEKNVKITTIDTMDEFDRYFNFLSAREIKDTEENKRLKIQDKVNGEYIYRGVRSAEELVPTLVRDFVKYKGGEGEANIVDIEKYENSLLFEVERNGSYVLESVDSVFDYISTMGHYGLPTRLLDWTRAPDIALMFAVFAPKRGNEGSVEIGRMKFDFENYYYIFKLDIQKHIRLADIPCYLDNMVLRNRYVLYDIPYSIKYQLMLKTVKQLFDKDFPDEDRKELIKEIFLYTNSEYLFNSFYNKKEADGFDKRINKMARKFVNGNTILFIEPRYSSRRVASQRGLFQLPVNLDGNVIKEQIINNSQVLAIKKDLRMDIICKFEGRGVNYYNLMPDLQGTCVYAHSDVKNWFKIKNQEVKK